MAGFENYASPSDNVEWLIGEPLDTLQIQVNGRNGLQRSVPAVHIGFMEVREFLQYKLLPVNSNDGEQSGLTAEEQEWVECMLFLEDDLHWLLKLPHHRFWSQVVHDENLHVCLESYLTLAPRDYDLVNLKLKDELSDALKKVHRLVFLVFLRMSTYKESKEHHIRPKAFGDMIYDKFLFDIPKLMNLCVLYGFQNKPVLMKMIKNIFTTQPKYINDLNETCPVVLAAFDFAEVQRFLNLPEKHDSYHKEDNVLADIKKMSLLSFYDAIGYITDSCATIHMFLEIYPPACQLFYQNGAVLRIASFYEQTFPPLEKEIKRLSKFNENESIVENIKRKLMLSKTFLIKTFRNILSYCCIQHIVDPSCCNERSSNIAPSEEFLGVFMEITCEKIFLHDYNIIYPFENDLELINETGAYLDPERLNYVFGSMHDSLDVNTEIFASTSENGARPRTQPHALQSSEEPVKSLQSIAAIFKPTETQTLCQNDATSTDSSPDNRPDEFELDSLIAAVQDVLPDLGDGFVEKCLEHFSYHAEKLIDALLTDSLPNFLNQLDRNLKRTPKTESSASNSCSKSSVLSERRNVYDNDEFDIFSGNDINMENIHIGKKNKTPNHYENLECEKESDFLKELIKTYAEQESDEEDYDRSDFKINIYEDEYDDTYDSALVGLKEPLLEDEPDKDEPPEENTENPYEENTNREPKPGDFCINPELVRQKNEERRQAKAAARNKGDRGGAHSNQNNKAHKDRHKAHIANHNRRKQSDYKKSRGMGSLPSR